MQKIEAVNDFVIKFANVNGSGSASANELFARAILRMGVPVSAAQHLPVEHPGLPTWYEVRVTERGYLGRRGGVDMMVAMNPQTWDQDVRRDRNRRLPVLRQHQAAAGSKFRDDIHVIGMPLTEICNAAYSDPRQRQLFKNIIYVGALTVLLDIDPAEIEKLIGEQYKGKEKLLDANVEALRSAATTRAKPRADRPARSSAATTSATASSSTATAPRRWAASMAARRSAPGIRSRRRRRSPRPSRTTAQKLRVDPETGSSATRSCRPRTNSPRSAWSSAPAGTARAPSPRPRVPASR
jgi:Pyruvate/2-oxoacid:ferredoxin oxidoreductase gamma subunit